MTFAKKLKSIRKQAESFDVPGAENIMELNGMKSELVICMDQESGPVK